MKYFEFILFSFIMHTGVVIAGDGFVWTDNASSKVQFGARIQLLKTWETALLVTQCAVKNESTEVCFVPVHYADRHIQILTVEYWYSVVREGDGPFAPREIQFISSGEPTSMPFVIEPQRFIRLAPGETLKFSPITVDMGNDTALTKISVKNRLRIDAPLTGFPTIEITRACPKNRLF